MSDILKANILILQLKICNSTSIMAERKRFYIPSSDEMEGNAKDGSSSFRPSQIFKSYKEQQSTGDEVVDKKKAKVESVKNQQETYLQDQMEAIKSKHIDTQNVPKTSSKAPNSSALVSGNGNKVSSIITENTSSNEQPENVPKLTIPGKTNSLLVNQRQRGNPLLKFVRNIPWEFGDIVPDYVMGQTTCALFLSLRYHQLNPNYIHERLKQLGRSYELRVLLVQIDIKEPHHLLKDLAKICILADCTLILAFSTEEAGRYLETYKVYENKPPDAIMEKTDQNFMAKMTECLTNIKSVNKTDVSTLISTFGSLKGIAEASQEDLSFCPGFGPQKAKRVHDLFKEPFLRAKKDKK